MEVKKITLKDRKKAQPKAHLYFSEVEKQTIIDTVAKGLDVGQRNVFFYTCQALGLNPLLNEVACVTYKDRTTGNRTMSIQVMRDGFLTIAHRSGKFAGIESGVNMSEDGKTVISGWAKVYHKDFEHPVYQEADFEEYNTPEKGGKYTLWKSKPKTMIKKVAESMALRKAFNVNGVYSPEEMEKEITLSANKSLPEMSGGDYPATEEQIATINSLDPEYKKHQLPNLTKQKAAELIQYLVGKKK